MREGWRRGRMMEEREKSEKREGGEGGRVDLSL